MTASAFEADRARAWNDAVLAHPGELDVEVERGRIEGAVPPALFGGRFLVNGPGWTRIGGRVAHPFDGHGYVRALSFEPDGSVRLRARFVRTPAYEGEARADRILFRGLGTNRGEHFWQNLRAGIARNVANTTIVPWAGRLLAGWEGGAPYALDPDSLETRGEETFGGAFARQSTLAHTKLDAAQGRLVFTSIAISRDTQLTFRELDAHGAVVASRQATLPGPLFAHDFAITPSWYVLAGNPLGFRPLEVAKALVGASTFIRCIRSKDEVPGTLVLVPRGRPGPVRIVELPEPAFVVHFGNAFDDGDTVHVDACAFRTFAFGAELGYAGPLAPLDPGLSDRRAPQRLSRFTVRAGASAAERETLTPFGVDFPRVHPRHDGQRTPFVVGASNGSRSRSDPFDSVLRVDLEDRARPPALWTAPAQTFVGEPVPVPSPETGACDAVLALLSEPCARRTSLLVFDAAAIDDGPVARVPLPLLPYGFHGAWEARDLC